MAVEAQGWELIARFVMIGAGIAIVHGYVPVRPGMRLLAVEGLAPVSYYAITNGAAAGSSVQQVLDTIVAGLGLASWEGARCR